MSYIDVPEGWAEIIFVYIRDGAVAGEDRALLGEVGWEGTGHAATSCEIRTGYSTILAAMDKQDFTKNDILSAYRTAFILKKMRQELNILAGEYLDQQTAKIVLDRLNSEVDKAKIYVGKTSFKLKDLLP